MPHFPPSAPNSGSPTLSPVGSRASWSGQLTLGPLTFPLKAYPALVVPSQGPLHQIHMGCGVRISQRKFCPQHGELTAAEIGKAFEFGPNDQLPISESELDSLAPTDDKTIRVEHLVRSDKFETSLLSGRSLFLAPSHVMAESGYAQAVVLLSHAGAWGIGRMVLADQRRAIAVRAEGFRLLLYVLHWPEHRRACPGADIDTSSVTPSEMRALEKALLPLHKSFAWEEYRDEGAERLNRLIAAKLASRQGPSAIRRGTTSKRSKGAARAVSRARQAA
ncbi:MAG: hypothetical protein C0483_10400 [Pirellula sp.]|nr:hypothetical protein [Pirellula sp.]